MVWRHIKSPKTYRKVTFKNMHTVLYFFLISSSLWKYFHFREEKPNTQILINCQHTQFVKVKARPQN